MATTNNDIRAKLEQIRDSRESRRKEHRYASLTHVSAAIDSLTRLSDLQPDRRPYLQALELLVRVELSLKDETL